MLPRLVALLALAAVLFGAVGSASAATATIRAGSGTLVARGAAVDVPVNVALACDEGYSSAVIELFLSQGEGRTVASGGGSSQVPCTSEAQTVTIRVFAYSDGAPFRGGSAVASGSLMQCREEPDWGTVCYLTDIRFSQVILLTGR